VCHAFVCVCARAWVCKKALTELLAGALKATQKEKIKNKK